MTLGPSIVDGRLRYVSVSQLERFDTTSFGGCERRWWFRYVAGAKEPAPASAKLGTQCHAQIEHYLKTGEDVLGEPVRVGKALIPTPGPDLLVEFSFAGAASLTAPVESLLDSAGVPFVGMIDTMHTRPVYITPDGVEEKNAAGVEVVDYKTTSKIDDEVDENSGAVVARGYAKTADQLAKSWQMTGYAEVARKKYGVGSVRVSHIYFQTRGPRQASKRTTLVSVDDVVARWRKAETLVEGMKAAARMTRPEDVTPNLASCNAYGGCPHRAVCPMDPKLAMMIALGGDMSLLDRMRQNKTTNGTTPTPMAIVPVTSRPEVDAEIERLKAEEAAARTDAQADAPALTPPDAPEPAKTAEPIALGSTLAVPGVCSAVGSQVELSIDDVAAKKIKCSTCGEAVKVKPTKLGGKYVALVTKHGVKAAPVVVPEIKLHTPAPTAPTEPAPVAQPIYTAPTAAIITGPLTLYLDAVEDGVVTKRLETFAEGIAADLAKACNVTDVRSAPKDSPLAYGGWKGLVAAQARLEPPSGAWAVSSTSEIGMVVFEALASTARVVRGVR